MSVRKMAEQLIMMYLRRGVQQVLGRKLGVGARPPSGQGTGDLRTGDLRKRASEAAKLIRRLRS